ncbi:hypothetical protein ANO11243_056940 [Dothideomycetidae sp. 11243]|nr:hypothetical protein ANO11243_056940 [fungal sp. No.11243]
MALRTAPAPNPRHIAHDTFHYSSEEESDGDNPFHGREIPAEFDGLDITGLYFPKSRTHGQFGRGVPAWIPPEGIIAGAVRTHELTVYLRRVAEERARDPSAHPAVPRPFSQPMARAADIVIPPKTDPLDQNFPGLSATPPAATSQHPPATASSQAHPSTARSRKRKAGDYQSPGTSSARQRLRLTPKSPADTLEESAVGLRTSGASSVQAQTAPIRKRKADTFESPDSPPARRRRALTPALPSEVFEDATDLTTSDACSLPAQTALTRKRKAETSEPAGKPAARRRRREVRPTMQAEEEETADEGPRYNLRATRERVAREAAPDIQPPPQPAALAAKKKTTAHKRTDSKPAAKTPRAKRQPARKVPEKKKVPKKPKQTAHEARAQRPTKITKQSPQKTPAKKRSVAAAARPLRRSPRTKK